MSVIQSISGKMIPLLGGDIDTDRIVPARFLKEVTFEKMGDYLFYDVRYDSAGNETDFVLNRPEYKEGSILVVGSNFGCGSSREHAPQAIKRYGVQAIVGVSFAEIFSDNCLSLGLPVVTLSVNDIEAIQTVVTDDPNVQVTLDLLVKKLQIGDQRYSFDILAARRQAFVDGTWDMLSLLKDNEVLIKAKDRDLHSRQ